MLDTAQLEEGVICQKWQFYHLDSDKIDKNRPTKFYYFYKIQWLAKWYALCNYKAEFSRGVNNE